MNEREELAMLILSSAGDSAFAAEFLREEAALPWRTALQQADVILASGWLANRDKAIAEATIRQHTQTVMDVQKDAMVNALVEAEERGYRNGMARIIARNHLHTPPAAV